MNQVSEKLSRESWLIAHELKAILQKKLDALKKEADRVIGLPFSDERVKLLHRSSYAFSTMQSIIRDVENKTDAMAAEPGWVVIREVSCSINVKWRACSHDTKRISDWPASDKRAKRLAELDIRTELMGWAFSEINRLKDIHGFNQLMKEKIRIDATEKELFSNKAEEVELTDAEMVRRIAAQQAKWSEEERERRIVGPRYDTAEIRVCKVIASNTKVYD